MDDWVYPVYSNADVTNLDDNGWEFVAADFGLHNEPYDFCLDMQEGVYPVDISCKAAVDVKASLTSRSEGGDASAFTDAPLEQRSEGGDASASTDAPLEQRTIAWYIAVPQASHGLLVCTLCGQAVGATGTKAGVRSHWRKGRHYPPVTDPELEAVFEIWEAERENLGRGKDSWIAPETLPEPIPFIAVVDTFPCPMDDCRKLIPISKGETKKPESAWREHMRTQHANTEFARAGRPGNATALQTRLDNQRPGSDVPAYGKAVKAQRVFGHGCYVTLASQPEAEPAPRTIGLQGVFAGLKQAVAREEKQVRLHIALPSRYETNPWAKAIGFADSMQGLHRINARQVLDRADGDVDETSAKVFDITGTLLLKCHAALGKTGNYRRKMLGQVDPGTPVTRPVGPYEADTTVKTAARVVQHCLSFFTRTQQSREVRAAVPAYMTNAEIDAAWTNLREHLEKGVQVDLGGREQLPNGTFLTPPERLVLALFVQLLRQTADDAETSELGLVVALTVLGIVPREERFKTANEYSSMLTHFIKMARCAVNAVCIRTVDLQVMVEEALMANVNTTMAWVTDKKRYARAVNKAHRQPGKMTWLEKDQAFLYGEHQLGLRQLSLIVAGLLEEQRRVLCNELLRVESLDNVPTIPWERLVDVVRDGAFESCWTDPVNDRALAHGRGWLADHVATTCADDFGDATSTRIMERAVVKYRHSMEKFASSSVVQAVLGMTMSMRATTAATIRWRNSDNGSEKRNLVVQRGRLTLVGGYTKTSWAGHEAPMHVLPDEVAQLWGLYVWLVLPFWKLLQAACPLKGGERDQGFLFQLPGAKRTDVAKWASPAVCQATASVLGRGMTLQPARQLVTQLVLRYIPADMVNVRGLSQDADGLQGGAQAVTVHTREPRRGQGGAARGRRRHSDSGDDTNTDDSDDEGDLFENDSDYVNKHDLVQAASAGGRTDAPAGAEQFEEVRQEVRRRQRLAHQTGHSLQMELTNYNGDETIHPNIDELAMQQWMAVGEYWHKLLRFPSAVERYKAALALRQARKRPQESDGQARQVKRKVEADDVSRDNGGSDVGNDETTVVTEQQAQRWLRTMVQDDKAVFRGRQWATLDALFNGRGECLLVVEPTGGGKTVLSLLPTLRPGARLTMLVTPFVALRVDVERRCSEAHIPCFVWKPTSVARAGMFPDEGVVVVMVEHLNMKNFRSGLRMLQAQDRLERVVIDEAHLILTARYWRSAVTDMPILTTIGAHLLFLSATLPPAREAELFKTMNLDTQDTRTLRVPIRRPNAAYSVRNALEVLEGRAGSCGPRRAADFVDVYRLRAGPNQAGRVRKTIVFLDHKGILDERGSASPHYFVYHSKVDQSEKEDVLNGFRDTDGAVLWATTAAEHSLDVSDVDDVIYVTQPESLELFVQGAGRAGRDGRDAEVIVLSGVEYTLPSRAPEEVQARNCEVMQTFTQPGVPWTEAKCRRKAIAAYMDGDDTREGCVEGVERRCDVCEWHAQAGTGVVPGAEGAGHEEESDNEDVLEGSTGDALGQRLHAHQSNAPAKQDTTRVAHGSARARRTSPSPPPPPPLPRENPDKSRVRRETSPRRRSSHTAGSSPGERRALPVTPCRTQAQRSLPTPVSATPRGRGEGYLFGHKDASTTPPPSYGSPAAVVRPRATDSDRERVRRNWQWRAVWNSMGTPSGLERVQSMLEFWQAHCAVHALEEGHAFDHTKAECPGSEQTVALGTASQSWSRKAAEGGWDMQNHTGCFRCKAPQPHCPGYGACSETWKHVIVDAWAACNLREDVRKWLLHGMGGFASLTSPEAKAFLRRGRRIPGPHNRYEKGSDLVVRLVDATERFFSKTNKDGAHKLLQEVAMLYT